MDSDPKILITKSDGSYLYLTTDLATVKNRLSNESFDKTLYVVDSRQKFHFEQLFKSLDFFEFPEKEYEHIRDWGMPIAQIICYINENKIDLEGIKIEDLEEIYPKASKLYHQDENFKSTAQNINKELNENKDDLIKNWKFLKEISVKAIKQTLSLLDHNFDLWMGESDVNNLIPKMIADLKDNEKISLDNGAYISNLDSEPKILITKSDGSYLYLTTDLATVLNRKKENDVDKTLYIVDKRQKLHFEQLFDSIKYFEFGEEEYTHVEFGTLNDLNGNPFKTRDGDTKS